MAARPSPSAVSMALLAGTATVVAGTAVGAAQSAPTGATRTVTVARGTVRATVATRGALAAATDAAVDFATDGRIETVLVTEGDRVKRGQLLARLDDASARAALKAARAAQAAAGSSSGSSGGGGETTQADPVAPAATVTPSPSPSPSPSPLPTPTATASPTPSASPTATATSDPHAGVTATPTPTPTPSATPSTSPARTPAPARTPSAPQPVTTAAPSAPDASSAGGGDTAALRQAVRTARATLRATKLRAPISGTIAQVNGKVGDAAGASDTTFTTIVNPRRYTVAVSVPETDIASVRRGQRATVTVDAVAGLRLAGHVDSIGVVPDSSGSTVTYPVTISLDAGTRRARSGMTAGVSIVVAQASGLVIPSLALHGVSVTAIRDGDRTTLRVTPGLAGDERTVIASGLSGGEQVLETSASAQAGAAATPAATTATRSASNQGSGGPPTGGGFSAGGPPGRP